MVTKGAKPNGLYNLGNQPRDPALTRVQSATWLYAKHKGTVQVDFLWHPVVEHSPLAFNNIILFQGAWTTLKTSPKKQKFVVVVNKCSILMML